MDTDVNYDGRDAQRTLVSNRTPKLILLAAGTWFFVLGAYSLVTGKPAYSALLFTAATLPLAAIRLEPKWRSRVAFSVASLLLTLYFAEVFVAALRPSQGWLRAWVEGRDYDHRTYHGVVRDLRARGIDAYPFAPPRALLDNPSVPELTPLSSITNTTTVFCNEGGSFLMYESDERGFHNPSGVWSGPADIVAVGDSYTHGACVSSSENFVAQVRERFPRTVNLGLAGNGPLMILAGLREYLPVLKPKVVFWCFYEGNDLEDLNGERHSPVLRRYLSDPEFRQDLPGRQPEVDSAVESFAQRAFTIDEPSPALVDSVIHRVNFRQAFFRILQFNHLLGVANRALDEPFGYGAATELEQLPLLGEILSQARSDVEAHGGRLVFVLLPGWDLAMRRSQRREAVKTRILETAARAGLGAIDLSGPLQAAAERDTIFWYPGAHYTPFGYRVVAEELLRELDRHPPEAAR